MIADFQNLGAFDMATHNERYGAHYWNGSEVDVYESPVEDLYRYTAYIGKHDLPSIERGGSHIMLSSDTSRAIWSARTDTQTSDHIAVHFPAYQCGDKQMTVNQRVNLPYINGCATRQLFAPERIGDPTFQQLTMPPFTSEQAHHIHPTARVVYVLKGQGWSIVGQEGDDEETELVSGMTCVLDPMCPHHFRTESTPLTVLPVHVFSSTPEGMESNHPMFNGTKEV